MIFIIFIPPFYYWAVTYITWYSGYGRFKLGHLFIFSLAYVGNASGIQACMNSAMLMLMALHQWVLYPMHVPFRCLNISQTLRLNSPLHDRSCHKSDGIPSSFSCLLRSSHTSYSFLASTYMAIIFAFCLHLMHSSLISILVICNPRSFYPRIQGCAFHPWWVWVCVFFFEFWSY